MAMPAGLELVKGILHRGGFKAVVFDFDGTLSLIREGWSRIMAELGCDLLRDRGLPIEPGTHPHFEVQMLRLSGKPSIFQMRKLAEEIAARGGKPPVPEELLQEFLRRLFASVGHRVQALTTGNSPPAEWAVPGSHALLENLRNRGLLLYLASGTDASFVRRELSLLGLSDYFGTRVYAPADNSPHFTKREVIEYMLREHSLSGSELLGFGDGFSEAVEVKRVGGTFIAVASNEPGVPGINAMKRTMLIGLGADAVVADYEHHGNWLPWLLNAKES